MQVSYEFDLVGDSPYIVFSLLFLVSLLVGSSLGLVWLTLLLTKSLPFVT